MTSALPRRSFLHRTAGLLAWASLGSALRSQDRPTTTFGLGFSLYGMHSLPLDEALRTCAEIGYDGVELCLLDGYPTTPAAFGADQRAHLRETLGALKLRVSGLMENISPFGDDAKHARNLERIAAAGQLAQDVSPGTPLVLETVLGGKPTEWEEAKEQMAQRLRDWAKAADAAKLVLTIKAHVMNAVQDPERLLWLWRAVDHPALQLAYDYSHFQAQNLSFDETFAAIMPHARFVHVKDEEGPAEKVKFLLPGEGTTDYSKYFQKLQAFGYRGDVVVEVSAMIFKQAGYDPKEAARKSYAALAAALTKAGLAQHR